ncbi:MAG: DNA topoisomerase IB [Dokdonella sp.]|uniref:DNA topoisomerase IB n=1 Tax=Dokdonella sp. TaxID=2291710 RepID=UPI002D0F3659|nr:DNA topoisomerase IB [Xanthomonadales bacterium]MBK7210621.1 DNA topoisomerase IB [Xanthomonadales bacterium]MBL0223170.1 DNA topoisomerase IB [Xanthomonadales bacterium]HQX64959.1 DNA topoisomerase IB [Dokdonella sp.]HQZ61277.1 DNA topoisomerase IB [Dokdonella sp.]
MTRGTRPVPAIDSNAEDARLVGLVHVSDDDPGIRRRRAGKGFSYVDAEGNRIADRLVIQRIRKRAIPPAYADVWICSNPRGHLQATGRDRRGRKQYRYHPRWRAVRDLGKFSRVIDFGQRLPRLRRALARDLGLAGLPRGKVLAIVVSLLAETLIRVGNVRYRDENKSFGLTTLLARHVAFLRGRAQFRFRGKGGLRHAVAIDDSRLVRLLRRCQQLPGQTLFQYIDDENESRPIDSGMVNDYLFAAMGGAFTAKDFRTWGATVKAIAVLAEMPFPDPPDPRTLATCVNEAIGHVANTLRNTPAVCRNSYIHPRVIAAWKAGELHQHFAAGDLRFPRKLERATLRFLQSSSA